MNPTAQVNVGDQVRMRQRGGAVPVVYRVTYIDEHRLVYLEAANGRQRTAHEADLILVQSAPVSG